MPKGHCFDVEGALLRSRKSTPSLEYMKIRLYTDLLHLCNKSTQPDISNCTKPKKSINFA